MKINLTRNENNSYFQNRQNINTKQRKQESRRVLVEKPQNYIIKLYDSPIKENQQYIILDQQNEFLQNIDQEKSQNQINSYFKNHQRKSIEVQSKSSNGQYSVRDSFKGYSINSIRASLKDSQRDSQKSQISLSNTMKTQSDILNNSNNNHNTNNSNSNHCNPNNINSKTQSRTPSPSNNYLYKQIFEMNCLMCRNHYNQQEIRQRYVRQICCDNNCDQILLCDECLLNIQNCKHSNKLPIKVLFNHPIMAFINEKQFKNQFESDNLLTKVVQQQSQLFNKIKDQVLYSKQLLKEYFNKLISQLTESSIQIQEQFNNKTEVIQIYQIFNQYAKKYLQQIRSILDSIQSTCNTYKNHFEMITAEALQYADCSDNYQYEQYNNNDQIIDKLKESLANYFSESDDPSQTLQNNVKQIQEQLNDIPQLNPKNMKTFFSKLIDPNDLNISFFTKFNSQKSEINNR